MAQEDRQLNVATTVVADIVGSPLVGVLFSQDDICGTKEGCDTFCSHVWHTMQDGKERLLDTASIKCPGARYVLRFEDANNPPEELIKELCSAHRADSPEEAEHMVRSLARMYGTKTIRLSRGGKGDVYIAYLKPPQVMVLVQAYQRIRKNTPVFSCSSLAPVCGVAAAQAVITGDLCISFGCHDSRTHGGITDCNVVVGIPHHLLSPLIAHVHELSQ